MFKWKRVKYCSRRWGWFCPNQSSNKAALDLIIEAIQRAGFTPGDDIALALDVASSELYENGVYKFSVKILQDQLMKWFHTMSN